MGMRHNGPCTCAQKLIDNNNALQRALATVQGERERYKEALEEIRKAYTEYCNEYAYSIAQAALAQPAAPSAPVAGSVDHPETDFGIKPEVNNGGICRDTSHWHTQTDCVKGGVIRHVSMCADPLSEAGGAR